MMNECYRKTKRMLVFSFFVCLLQTGITAEVTGQYQSRMYAENIFNGTEYISVYAMLNEVIDLNLESSTRINAVQEISRITGLRVSYDTELPQLQEPVDFDLNSVTAEEALWTVLEGSGLGFSVSSHGQLVLFPFFHTQREQQYQTGTLTGVVVDAENGETIPGANIYLPETGQGASTGADGEFRIFQIQSGVHEVQISYISYETLETQVEIVAGDTTDVEFELGQRRSQLDEIVVTGYGARREVPTGAITSIGR